MHPQDRWAVLWKADLLVRLGHLQQAEQCIRQAQLMDPIGDFEYRRKLNTLFETVLSKNGKTKEARKYADLAEGILLEARARDLTDNGLLSLAEVVLKKAVNLCPNDADMQIQLANCLTSECRPDEAKPHFLAACKNAPFALGEDTTGSSVALMFYRTRLASEEKPILDNLIRQNPKDAKCYFARGTYYEYLGFTRQAISDFNKTVELDPNYAEAWRELDALALGGIIKPDEAQNVELRLISQGIDSLTRQIELRNVKNLGKAYRLIQQELLKTSEVDDSSLLPLQSKDSKRYNVGWGWGYSLLSPKNQVGGYLGWSDDIRTIVGLYKPSRFPFE